MYNCDLLTCDLLVDLLYGSSKKAGLMAGAAISCFPDLSDVLSEAFYRLTPVMSSPLYFKSCIPYQKWNTTHGLLGH